MKNRKITFIGLLFIFFIILGTLKVNASQEINTIEDMVFILGNENIEVNENEIKLLNDINLRDNLIVKNGNYVLDLKGKTISYDKNYETLLCIDGGNITIKDEMDAGELISKGATISSYKGSLKIENCKVTSGEEYGISLSVTNEGTVQIDNGEFLGVQISTGNLIINGGVFKHGLDVYFAEFSNKLPNVIINDGEFIGGHAGLYIWFSQYAKNIQLKGGTFKGNDEQTPGIFVGGDRFSLRELLPIGYRFDNSEQNVEVQEFGDGDISYHTTSANEVSVERYINRNIIKLIFVDYDGNIIKTKSILQGKKIDLPEAPEKEGYVFVGWDIDPEKVTNDMVVTPIYEKIYNLKVDVIYDEYYTGEEITPNIAVIDASTKERLSEEDYEIICENNINVGTANVLVKGKGKYKYSTQEVEFKILPITIYHNCELYCQREYEYTGEEIRPNIDVYYREMKLINGVDYEVYYEANINAGTGSIIVSGIGNYTGKSTKMFRINKRQIDEVILKQINFAYSGNKILPEVIVKAGDKELIENVDYRVYYSNNINVGAGYIKINGSGNYSGEKTLEFNIVSKNIQDMNIKLDLSNKQYTGGYITPTVAIFDGNYKLKENFDYTVEYSNNFNIGKATIKITGKKGYVGTIVETFEIIPKKVQIKSIKAPIIRTVKLTWQKDCSIDGYEIYRSNEKEGNYSLVKTINRKNKDNCLFLAHKKGTFYYTMRTYKIVNGNKIYSDFSDIKEIKVR